MARRSSNSDRAAMMKKIKIDGWITKQADEDCALKVPGKKIANGDAEQIIGG